MLKKLLIILKQFLAFVRLGVENFEKLRRNDMYYVDKTEIIADLLRNHGDANLFTRPRRFGKTLTS